MNTFLKSIILGIAIAAPLGPVAVYLARETLCRGFRAAFLAGLGAALADALFGSVVAFGLVAVADLLTEHKTWIYPLGGVIICAIGVRLLWHRVEIQERQKASAKSVMASVAATFVLTLSNPGTLIALFFVAAYLELHVGAAGVGTSLIIVLGVFLGSTLWWLLLTGGVKLFLTRLPDSLLVIFNRVQGVIIIGFGLFVVASGFFKDSGGVS